MSAGAVMYDEHPVTGGFRPRAVALISEVKSPSVAFHCLDLKMACTGM